MSVNHKFMYILLNCVAVHLHKFKGFLRTSVSLRFLCVINVEDQTSCVLISLYPGHRLILLNFIHYEILLMFNNKKKGKNIL